jgi:O-succinylbenzoate synthase
MLPWQEVITDLSVISITTRTDFRGVNTREAVIFRGTQGWSEFSPFVEYQANEATAWLTAALEAAYKPWPKNYRNKIAINATLPRVNPDRVPEILARFPGANTIKIKVNDFEEDSYLVEAALEFNPDAKIRLDVNAGWTLEEALLNLYDYNLRFGNVFEYIEQPCVDLEDLAKLKAEIPMKIALDESIRKAIASDFSDFQRFGDIAIIKWQPSGGFANAQKLISKIGLPVVISSALETGIGISHGLALAAAQPELDFACGLGTVSLLTDDVTQAEVLNDGYLEVRPRTPDLEKLAKLAAPGERKLWWQDRITEIWNNQSEEWKSRWVS